MKKVQAVLLALLATFALGALLVSTASAETTHPALWLANGNTINANLNVETPGNVLLEDTKVPIVGAASLLCSWILDGTVGPEGQDAISEVLNLKDEKIGELSGLSLSSAKGDCATEDNCGTPIEVWPAGLPWPTLLFIMENGEILDLVEKLGFEILCTVVGVNVEDECTFTDTEIKVENDPATGDAANPAEAKATPNANCTEGGVGSGVYQIDELIETKLMDGELLTVSEQ